MHPQPQRFPKSPCIFSVQAPPFPRIASLAEGDARSHLGTGVRVWFRPGHAPVPTLHGKERARLALRSPALGAGLAPCTATEPILEGRGVQYESGTL